MVERGLWACRDRVASYRDTLRGCRMGSTGCRDKVRAYRDALPACRDLLVEPCDGLACCWGEAGRGFKRLVYRVRGNDEVAMLRSRRRRRRVALPNSRSLDSRFRGNDKVAALASRTHHAISPGAHSFPPRQHRDSSTPISRRGPMRRESMEFSMMTSADAACTSPMART